MLKKLFFITSLFITSFLGAQIGIGTTTPHSSTALDIVSDHSGITVPRLTTIERDDNPHCRH